MSEKRRKSEDVYRWLRLYVEQNKFSDNLKLPSENFICNKFLVSRTTVRESLRLLTQEGLIYAVRGSGTYINQVMVAPLEYGDSNEIKIGAILQGQDKGAIHDFLEGIRDEIKGKDIGLYIYYTDNTFANERYCLQMVMTQNFSGFIIDGVKSVIINPNLDCYEKLLQKKKPVIFYNNYYSSLPYPRVTTDNQSSAKLLLGELLNKGHKQIVSVFWCDNQQSLDKFAGYTKMLCSRGLSFQDDDVYWCMSSDGVGDSFARNFLKFLRTKTKATAIVCCNYLVYCEVKKVIERLNKKIPEQYSVVCFDYSEKNLEDEGVTCTIHPAYEMGQISARNLTRMIFNKIPYADRYSQKIPPKLYEGISVKNLRDT
ncbi:MAG: GntR family transcriptional regulator [Bacillota bacterium]